MKGDGEGSSSKEATQRFEFKLLNDQAQLKADVDALDKLQDGDLTSRLPSDVTALISEAVSAEDKAEEDQLKGQRSTIVEQVKEDLAGGLTVREVKSKLQQRTFVLEFDDAAAVQRPPGGTKQLVKQFAEACTLMLATASRFDEVVVKITSPGGAVTEYGLASSQLLRLKKAGIRTTVCVDTVAASGGYMMACVADRVVASPFAFLGSIGVVAGMPNIHKALERNDVEYLMFTAGKFKRTVTALTEATDEAKAKFQSELEEIHNAFSTHVEVNRGELVDKDLVATGEAWLALQAVEKGLVDELMTSDEYLRMRMCDSDVIQVTPKKKKKGLPALLQQFAGDASTALSRLLTVVNPMAETLKRPEPRFEHNGGHLR